MKKIKVSTLKPNPNNPRIIKDDKFYKLVESIKDFGNKMMPIRPIVIDEKNIILAGNMRCKAIRELKIKEIPESWVKKVEYLTEEEKKEFIIKDNIGFGVWDWEALTNGWDSSDLIAWGLEIDLGKGLDDLAEGEELEFEQSGQLEPPKEYILIMAEPNSVDWEEIKQTLKLKMVRRGGYKKGSAFDSVGLERVLNWGDFKKRINANSDTK